MDSVVVGTVDLAVRDLGGSGPAVLLLHGAGSTLADLAPLASCLAADHRVVAMDLRNHGRSGDGPWTWDAALDDVRVVIEKLELTNPLLVGHSLGGILAALYAQRRGGVAGAVNLDGWGTGTPEQYDMDAAEAGRLIRQLRAVGDASIESLTGPRSADQVDASRQAWIAGAQALGLSTAMAEEAFDRPLVAGADGTFTRRPTSLRLAELRSHIDDLDMLGLYELTTTPQLVYVAVRDQGDPGLPAELNALASARRRGLAARLRPIARERPNVRVIELDATHGLIYELPQLLADQIRDFATGMNATTVKEHA